MNLMGKFLISPILMIVSIITIALFMIFVAVSHSIAFKKTKTLSDKAADKITVSSIFLGLVITIILLMQ